MQQAHLSRRVPGGLALLAALILALLVVTPAFAATPAVTSIAPSSGPSAGGTAITITGTGLTGTTAVKFGTVDATSFANVTDTTVTAVAPAHVAGTVNVIVTNADGSSAIVAGDLFTFVDSPTVTVHASGLFSVSEAPNPLLGWTLSLRVRREGGVQGWQRLVRDALEPLPLASVFSWEQQQPHLNIVQQLPTAPREALARLGDYPITLTFTATRMIVSERNGDRFVNLLEQPLRGPSPAAQQAEQHAR